MEVAQILRGYNEKQLKELKDIIERELKGDTAQQGIRIEKDFSALYTNGGYAKFRETLPKAIDILLAEKQFPWLRGMTKEKATALRNIIDRTLGDKGGLFVNTLTQVVNNEETRQSIVDLVNKGQGESLLAALNRKVGKPEK